MLETRPLLSSSVAAARAGLDAAWDAAEAQYQQIPGACARFNVELLRELRRRWSNAIRPDTSMLQLLFTRPDETGYHFTERVEVTMKSDEVIEMALVRDVPRGGLAQAGGVVVVTGDFTAPERALPAVEALLLQLAEPAARQL